MMGSMMLEERRIVGIPHDQSKLHATTPVIRDAIGIGEAMFEVHGSLVDVIAEGKQEDTPVLFAFSLVMRGS